MHEGGAVEAKLDAAGLGLVDGLADVLALDDGAGAGAGHEAAGSEDLPEAADLAHYLLGGDGHIEIGPAVLDLLGQVVAADEVGAGVLGELGGLTLGEGQDAHLLAQAVGEDDVAPELLLGVTGVEVGAEVQLDGLVEGGEGGLFGQPDGLLGLIELVAVDLGQGF